MLEGEHYPDCFDPYLRYAISTDFRNFEFFDEERFCSCFFLVELHRRPDRSDEFANEEWPGSTQRSALSSSDRHSDVGHTRYVTMRVGKQAVID